MNILLTNIKIVGTFGFKIFEKLQKPQIAESEWQKIYQFLVGLQNLHEIIRVVPVETELQS